MQPVKHLTLAAILAALALGGPASAQSGMPLTSPGTVYTMVPNSPDETAEQRTANAEETVIIHFTGNVTYLSALQLVVMVQEYFRRGYRKFVMPIQTGGGAVLSAMYAHETLSRMPIEFSTVAIGNVDSSGVYLYCLGDKRYAAPGASFLFHPMRGMIDSNRRGQEAAEREVESLNTWSDGVIKGCFGEKPEEWDLERRDYRVTTGEASAVGLVNAGSDYFEDMGPLGEISYVYPIFLARR